MGLVMKTGEIWLAQFDPTVGSQIQKTRPCVVISPNEMNVHLRTVIVAPMTTGSRPARFRIPLTFQAKQGLIVLDQLRTLDRGRLVKRQSEPGSIAAAVEPPDRLLPPHGGRFARRRRTVSRCAMRRNRQVGRLLPGAHFRVQPPGRCASAAPPSPQ